MRVAIVAESFLPHMNGVTNSVLHVLAHLREQGHQAMVIAPAGAGPGPESVEGFPVVRLAALPLNGYSTVRVAAGSVLRVRRLLAGFAPDVVHLASPFVLGWRAIQAAEQLGLPTVSVYQTEVPAYAARYGAPWLEPLLWNHVRTLHEASTVNLVPSTHSMGQLRGLGVRRTHMWRRGVDTQRFRPSRRGTPGGAAFRARVAPNGERIIGYVGRLAAEKQVEDLAVLDGLPDTRLAIVGSGPLREGLRDALPNAHFTGFLGGEELADAVAGFDLFVHPGEAETFCQTIQEAMASGVPVVAVGRGGPVDLVDSSRTGWLYAPGDLAGLRGRVEDLAYDDAKRLAFGTAAHAAVRTRTWPAVCAELVGHYRRAVQVKSRQLDVVARGVLAR